MELVYWELVGEIGIDRDIILQKGWLCYGDVYIRGGSLSTKPLKRFSVEIWVPIATDGQKIEEHEYFCNLVKNPSPRSPSLRAGKGKWGKKQFDQFCDYL